MNTYLGKMHLMTPGSKYNNYDPMGSTHYELPINPRGHRCT